MSTKKTKTSGAESVSNRTTVQGSIYPASNKSGIQTTYSDILANTRPRQGLETPQNRFIYSNPTYGWNQKTSQGTAEWDRTISAVLPLIEANRESAKKSLSEYRQRYFKNQRRSTRKNRKNRRATRKRAN